MKILNLLKKDEDFAKSMTSEEYYKLPRNPHLDKEIQKLNDERFDFYNSLNEKQIEALNKIVLNVIDSTAFNFLRELEENLDEMKVLDSL